MTARAFSAEAVRAVEAHGVDVRDFFRDAVVHRLGQNAGIVQVQIRPAAAGDEIDETVLARRMYRRERGDDVRAGRYRLVRFQFGQADGGAHSRFQFPPRLLLEYRQHVGVAVYRDARRGHVVRVRLAVHNEILRIAVIHVRMGDEHVAHRRQIQPESERMQVRVHREIDKEVVVDEHLAARTHVAAAAAAGVETGGAVAEYGRRPFGGRGAQISYRHSRNHDFIILRCRLNVNRTGSMRRASARIFRRVSARFARPAKKVLFFF